MKKLWKDFKVNFMYWRFRNITRNRLRLQSWWNARRSNVRPPGRVSASVPPVYRARGTAAYYDSGRASTQKSWAALLAMVALLTALTYVAAVVFIYPALVYGIGALIVIGAMYVAMRGA